MDRYEDLVPVAVDPHRVIIVLVFVDSWRELDVDVLSHTSRYHPLLLVLDLEEGRLRRQNMETLGRRRVVDQS